MTTNDFSPGHVPHLEPGDAPWTDAELQLREKLLADESVPPASLEADIWAAMDRPSAPVSSGRFVALAVAGGLAALAWFWPADVSETVDAKQAPTVHEATYSGEKVAPGVQEEATIDDEVLAPLLEAAPEDVASDVARSAPSEMPAGNGAQHDEGMTSIQGLGVSELKGGNEGERFPLKQDSTPVQQERREATLEVKQ